MTCGSDKKDIRAGDMTAEHRRVMKHKSPKAREQDCESLKPAGGGKTLLQTSYKVVRQNCERRLVSLLLDLSTTS